MNRPIDMVRYIVENNYEGGFMNSLAYHVGGFSIAEIADRRYVEKNGKYFLKSEMYSLDIQITDDEIFTALKNGLYVSAFISRKDDGRQLHFLVHQYPVHMKAQFDEEILKEVIQYMVLKTVIALRLDTEKKVDDYIKASIMNQSSVQE